MEHFGPVETDTRILIVGNEDSWRLHGHVQSKICFNGMSPNSMKAERLRPMKIDFKDGSKYTFMTPGLEIDGTVRSKRVIRIVGQLKIVDSVNKLTAVVDYLEPES